ncbi:hypothetical protein C2E23DRAFT_863352 [Lenzites betulinus]|nr:hypothetical protein C2E23DRAFT_863352 [Lenzites betulinus]
MLSHAQSSRLNNYHTPKQRILGNSTAHPAPAWRPNAKAAASGSNVDPGSRILISRLPLDVVEEEVETLFTRTVGHVKEVFMIYNSQANPRGMAVVTFARSGHAAVARAKYNGKFVDNRRPIKIEIIVDDDDVQAAPPPPTGMPSLLERLGPPRFNQAAAQPHPRQAAGQAKGGPPNHAGGARPQAHQAQAPNNTQKVGKLRAKKGPRRLNKQRQQPQGAKQSPKKKTVEDLDREMEEYKARAQAGKIKVSASASSMVLG